MTPATRLNGVPVDQLVETMRVIRKDPEIAQFKFHVRNNWLGGGHNRARANEYHGACESHGRKQPFLIDMDEPPVLLGSDRGPNPVEQLLAALSGCLTTSLVYHAAARGIRIDTVESRYEGDLDLHGFLGMDESVRNGFQRVRATFQVTGDATAGELDELVDIAKARSPVFDMLRNPVDVEVTRADLVQSRA